MNKMTITKQVEWNMGHRIPKHPKDTHLHGHRMTLEVSILIDRFVDIGLLKECLNKNIVDSLDHSFVFWKNDKIMTKFFNENSKLKHLQLQNVPTMENMLIWIQEKLQNDPFFKNDVVLTKLKIWESPVSSATLEISPDSKELKDMI